MDLEKPINIELDAGGAKCTRLPDAEVDAEVDDIETIQQAACLLSGVVSESLSSRDRIEDAQRLLIGWLARNGKRAKVQDRAQIAVEIAVLALIGFGIAVMCSSGVAVMWVIMSMK